MWFFRFGSRMFLRILLILSCSSLYAQTVEQTVVTAAPTTTSTVVSPSPSHASNAISIITPVPAPKEVLVTPTGYVKCITVKAKWHHHVWISEHRSCQYKKLLKTQTHKGTVWVDGYWACTKHQQGACITWKWESGHWESL